MLCTSARATCNDAWPARPTATPSSTRCAEPLGAVGLAPRAFFGECRLLLAHCGPVLEGALGGDAAALANLPRLAARFAHAELLFCKAEAFATGCFAEEHAGRARAAAWLLFLACRAEVEAGAGGVAMDLVSAFCLMLAVQARVPVSYTHLTLPTKA